MVLFYVDGIFYLDVAFSIENRMNARAFRDIWAQVMFLKFSKLHVPQACAIWNPLVSPSYKNINCVRRRRTLPNFVGLLWSLAKALRVFLGFLSGGQLLRHILVAQRILPRATQNSVVFAYIGWWADVLLKNFVAAAVFSVSYFLNVVEEFRRCLSKPEGGVYHFGLSIGRAVMTAVCYIFGFHKVTIVHVPV